MSDQVTETIPEPPIAAYVDLRTFDCMPLDVVRLANSDILVETNGDQFKAAVLLWARAWHQVPAGSLPNCERKLAHMAGLGRDVRLWRRLREGALRGFVLCTDGRMYHAVICQKAREAWAKKVSGKEGAEVRWGKAKSRESREFADGNASNKADAVIAGSDHPSPLARTELNRTDQNQRPGTLAKVPAVAMGSDVISQALEIYNAAAARVPAEAMTRCAKLTEVRERNLRARVNDVAGVEGWAVAIERAVASDFLMGRIPRDAQHANWKLDIDFLLQESSFTKLMEGTYDNRSASIPAGPGATRSSGSGPRSRPNGPNPGSTVALITRLKAEADLEG